MQTGTVEDARHPLGREFIDTMEVKPVEIGKAFSYVFEDEKWVSKVLIGALFYLLSIIIIGWFFVAGYFVEIIRNVASGNPNPLPEWDNLGSKLAKGFILSVVSLVYSLPAIVLYACAFVPSFLVSGREGDALSGLAAVLSLAGFCLLFIYMVFLFIIYPAVAIRYAITGSFSACFQFGQIFSFITSNLGNYVIALLLTIVASIIGQIGAIACFIGVFVTSFYALAIMGHLYGQVYRQAVAGGTGFRTV